MVRDDEEEENYTVGAAMGCAMMIGLGSAIIIGSFVIWYIVTQLLLLFG
jgi:hypothetical protein